MKALTNIFFFAVAEYVTPRFRITTRDVELGEVEISYSIGTGARSAALIGARERKHTLRWQASLDFSRCKFESICEADISFPYHNSVMMGILRYLYIPALTVSAFGSRTLYPMYSSSTHLSNN